MPGYAYPKDTPWQKEFEDAFPYELLINCEPLQKLKQIWKSLNQWIVYFVVM